jgi:hypothetical protein
MTCDYVVFRSHVGRNLIATTEVGPTIQDRFVIFVQVLRT